MTFEDRVAALDSLGLTPRQTRFVMTVARHGGYCLRRQYLRFAGLRYGKNVRDFLDRLVDRGLAERFCYQPNRVYVYHLRAKSLYRRLHQEDNRNRRHVSPALIARKLMLLDYVLTVSGHDWYATEEDKVAFFMRELSVPLSVPARRVAVLTDSETNSSGEATAVAFRGRPDTRTFGGETCGRSSGIGGITLSDGGTLGVLEALDADRLGRLYGGKMPPDDTIHDDMQMYARVVNWLRSGQ